MNVGIRIKHFPYRIHALGGLSKNIMYSGKYLVRVLVLIIYRFSTDVNTLNFVISPSVIKRCWKYGLHARHVKGAVGRAEIHT